MQGDVAVIFDMDGVIIDSSALITKAWQEFFSMYNVQLSNEQLKNDVFGRTATDIIKTFFKPPLDEEKIREYQKTVDQSVQTLYLNEGVILPGFKSFVELLIQHQIPIGIATSAPVENVNVVLHIAKTKSYFNTISDTSQIRYSKPHPEIYLITASKLGIDPTRCCVFEDSLSGIQSAKHAGMKVIGVTTTHTIEELLPITDFVIKDFSYLTMSMIKRIIEG